tara:strand:- start:6155 stop:6892 length:738 start_codon:yes stop_codon:yes gene_type:complete
MDKRGQTTIFIIIALIIVALAIVFFVVRNNISIEDTGRPIEIEPVNDFIIDCLEETGENALREISEKGGYFFIPENLPSIDSRIPYYIHNERSFFPRKSYLESSLSAFVFEELSFCILNFKNFRDEFRINSELKEVNTKILENSIKFSLNYEVSIEKEDTDFLLENFELIISSRLNDVYNTAFEIVNEEKTHLESICLSCLYDFGEKNNVSIDMLDYGDKTTIFTILDDSEINNNNEFNFAIQYE